MSVFVKICGLRDAECIAAAVHAGADAIGFVFAESVRKISAQEARDLARDIPAGVPATGREMETPRPDRYGCQWAALRPGIGPD